MGYQIDKNGVIIRQEKGKTSKGKVIAWIAIVLVVAFLVIALWPKEGRADSLYSIKIPHEFMLVYDNGCSQRNYQDGNGGGIGVYYEGGGWGESVDDYLRKKELDISLYTPLQINWMEARSIKEETVDFVYNSFVIISDYGIFVIKFDYPIGRKSYYEGLMDEVVYSFKQK